MNVHNISTIARYEVKLLKRSWLFRIFATLALLGITFMLLGSQTRVLSRFNNLWSNIALSSQMPFTAVYYYNMAQSIIAVFLAGSFLKRDKKLDTAEVIYVRPMSNADYIIGKTWGIIKVFITLNFIILLITAFLNTVINQSPFSVFPYIFYLLTISFPSLLFILGLSFTMMCLLKNQAVTFIVMLGLIGVASFYLEDTLFGVFDFYGVFIPTIFSDVTGHADLRLFLLQRFIYLAAGVGLVSFTISLVKRLPHKPWKIIIVNTIGAIFLAAACCCGFLYVLHYNHQLNQREQYAATFNRYASYPQTDILVHDLTLIPQGKELEGNSTLKIKNNTPEATDKIILYLNPSLQISSVTENNHPLSYERDHQAIVIRRPLQAKEELTLSLRYKGKINENVCYTDVPLEEYVDTKIPQAVYRFGKRYAWVEDKFLLLTPECLWYPVSVAPSLPQAPYEIQSNFTDYTLTVKNFGDKTVVSQGQSKKTEDGIVFTNMHPLPGITLTIADYEKKALQVDSVDYEIYYFKGHDYFSKEFDKLYDTLIPTLREYKNDLEVAKNRDYPFSKFVLAETPIQFATYARNWKGYTEYVAPEIVFVPERGATLNFDFKASHARSREWRRPDQGMPDESEQEINVFKDFLQNTFVAENVHYGWDFQNQYVNKFNIAPLFFNHTGFIRSDEYPVLNVAVNTMLNNPSANGMRRWGGIINDQQRANLYLEDHSFKEAVRDNEIKPEILYELLKLKSSALENYVTSYVSTEDFKAFLKDFFARHSFQNIPFATLEKEFTERFDVNLKDFLERWYTEDHSPTIYIKDVDANQVVIDEFTKYQIKFKVHNPSDVDAIITAQTMQGGGWGGRGGRGGGNNASEDPIFNYIIPAGTAWEIKIINDERPANLTVNTNISHNLPAVHNFNFSKIDNTIADTTSGIFPVSPSVFAPNPHEIIIDNEDKGFRTIASNKRHKLKDLFKKEEKEKYKNFMPWWMPSQWTSMAADYCYGETVNSAVYKRAGSGGNQVEWEAQIPKEGYYEIFIWNPKMTGGMMMRGRRNKEDRVQTYTVESNKEKESIPLDMRREDAGWVSIGNFYLPKGPVIVRLSDKVEGSYVIADAVKFTAVEE